MPVIDLSAYKPVPATLGDANQIANGMQAIQNTINGIDNLNFAAGKIFDPAKIMQNAAATGDAMVWDGANWVKHSAIAVPAAQTFVDSGSTDFFTNGLWLVEADTQGTLLGAALVYMGNNTATGTKHITVIGSGANTSGIVPTFAAVNQDTNTGVLRVSTVAASGLTVTVHYRRITKTI